MVINGIELVETCGACPEQYDAMLNGKQVGYLRLRHGHFRCDFLYSGGETVYEADTRGDGMFADGNERGYHLTMAVNALLSKLKEADIIAKNIKI